MERPTSNARVTTLLKPLLPLGTTTTVLFMLGLCAPLGWYSGWLLEHHGPTADMAGLPPLELLLAMGLLALPFAALRLLGIDWQPDR